MVSACPSRPQRAQEVVTWLGDDVGDDIGVEADAFHGVVKQAFVFLAP